MVTVHHAVVLFLTINILTSAVVKNWLHDVAIQIVVVPLLIIITLKYVAVVKYQNEEPVTLVVVQFPTTMILNYVAMVKLLLKVLTLDVVVEKHFITRILVYVVVEK